MTKFADLPDTATPPTDKPSAARRRLLYAGVAGTAALGGAGLAWWKFQPHAVEPGAEQALWGMQFDKPEGGVVSLGAMAGKPLLLNFWATWCPPCVEELPLLSSFYNENKANGWQLIGLAVDKPEPVARFLAKSPVSFPVALAGLEGVELTRALGNAAGGLPFSVLFDTTGQLRDRKLGQLHARDLAAWRDRLGRS